MSPMPQYDLLETQVREMLATETDFVANAANFAAFVYHALPEINWAGFYLATPSGELLLGPFCGRPACARLAAGRGVCGASAARRQTLVVDDVAGFADHIVCDSASRSEIVVPFLVNDSLYGVFDCDTHGLPDLPTSTAWESSAWCRRSASRYGCRAGRPEKGIGCQAKKRRRNGRFNE
jgi:L-methionine (R)-S-oxide reductase